MKPLLAHIYEPHRVTYPCYVQPKLNGIRALYQSGNFQSRDQLPFPKGLLEHLAEPLRQTFGPEVILDGELYVHGWSLQRINAAVTPVRLQPTEDTVKVEYHCFDVVNFEERFHVRQLIRQRIQPHIHCVETYIVDNEEQANRYYAGFVEQGYEGMMYRLGNCPYTIPKQPGKWGKSRYLSDQSNRCWHLLKRKDWQDDDYVITQVHEGKGKCSNMVGAFSYNCPTGKKQIYDPLYKGDPRVGSGLSDSERQHYWSNPPIGRQVKVKYLCLSDAGIPLNPTILCIL